MVAAVVAMTFVVQRRTKTRWQTVHVAASDEAAAQLAKALVDQAPMEPIRIILHTSGEDGGEQEQVVWEYDAIAFRPPGDRGGVPLPRGELVSLKGVFESPDLPDRRAEISARRRSLSILTLLVAMVVAVLVVVSLNQAGGPLRPAVAPTPPETAGGATASGPQISYLQAFVVRRYAYMSCVNENLAWGLQVARDAFRTGRLTGDLLRLYEDQYRDVAKELLDGRRLLTALPADKGGLGLPLMGFVDEWFRLNREILWRGRLVEDVVNPEDFCKREAEEGNFIQAFEIQRRRRGG